jgi:CheY-like chemotaxis protein
VEQLRPEAERKNLVVTTHFGAQVPSHVRTDPTRLRQILANLLSNAVKYTNTGSVRVHVGYRREPDGDRLTVTVCDTGPGLSEPEREYIFDRNARLDYTVPSAGSGLGLTITRGLLTRMGGEISCESTLGEGSTFRFELPVTPVGEARSYAEEEPGENEPQSAGKVETNDALPDARGTPSNTDTAGTAAADLRILVAEDDRMNRILIRHLLERLGHRATLVGNGREAVTQLRGNPFDLVLMDIQMPQMDGLEATRRIRADREVSDIPIIGLTAYAAPEDRQEFAAGGMDMCLTKPLRERELARALARVKSRRSRPG